MISRDVFPWEWVLGEEPDMDVVRKRQQELRKQIESIERSPNFRDYLLRVRVYDDYVSRLDHLGAMYGTGTNVLAGFYKQFDGDKPQQIEPDSRPDSVLRVPLESVVAPMVQGEWSGNCCPECGTIMIFQEGCLLCRSCGYSKCG